MGAYSNSSYSAEELPCQPLPRSGRCDCGGEYVREEHPKPGVEWAVLCAACGKWLQWELSERADTIGTVKA